jgi:hypothetical protein
MNLWHLTPDAPRQPERPCPGQAVELWIGTWPIETGQRVHVACHVLSRDGRREAHEGRHFGITANPTLSDMGIPHVAMQTK